jgi:hypothetical protein
MSDSESTITTVAPHQVSGNWPEGSDLFFFNPASGAVEVRPAHRDKVARSLTRQANAMKRRLFLLQFRLQVEYFSLKARRAVLRLLRHFLRDSEKTVGYPHKTLPKGRHHAD